MYVLQGPVVHAKRRSNKTRSSIRPLMARPYALDWPRLQAPSALPGSKCRVQNWDHSPPQRAARLPLVTVQVQAQQCQGWGSMPRPSFVSRFFGAPATTDCPNPERHFPSRASLPAGWSPAGFPAARVGLARWVRADAPWRCPACCGLWHRHITVVRRRRRRERRPRGPRCREHYLQALDWLKNSRPRLLAPQPSCIFRNRHFSRLDHAHI